MQSLLLQRNKHHVWVGTIFAHLMVKDNSSIASIQHLSKTVPIQVAQHLKEQCNIMWMKVGTDLSLPRFERTREEDLKEIPTHI